MVCQCALVSLGWIFFLYLLYRLATVLYNIIYPFFIATPINLQKAAGGKWAVVTGSTDGIGKAYAFELARHGFSIILISRTQSKLDAVMKELEKECGVEVKTIAFDFTNGNLNEFERAVLSPLRELDIGVLVNNVGVSFAYPEIIHKVEGGLQRLADVDIVNTLPVTLLSAAILPQMVERNKGIIVNLSSATAYIPLSMFSVYSASKISRASFFCVTPENFAKSAVRTIGVMDETTGCFSHQLQVEILKFLPDRIVSPYLDGKSKLIRKKALAKKAREMKATS